MSTSESTPAFAIYEPHTIDLAPGSATFVLVPAPATALGATTSSRRSLRMPAKRCTPSVCPV